MGNEMVDYPDVIEALPVGAALTTSSILVLTPGFRQLGKDNCETRRETFTFGDVVRLILDVWQ